MLGDDGGLNIGGENAQAFAELRDMRNFIRIRSILDVRLIAGFAMAPGSYLASDGCIDWHLHDLESTLTTFLLYSSSIL